VGRPSFDEGTDTLRILLSPYPSKGSNARFRVRRWGEPISTKGQTLYVYYCPFILPIHPNHSPPVMGSHPLYSYVRVALPPLCDCLLITPANPCWQNFCDFPPPLSCSPSWLLHCIKNIAYVSIRQHSETVHHRLIWNLCFKTSEKGLHVCYVYLGKRRS
jgi:hypothetical protein